MGSFDNFDVHTEVKISIEVDKEQHARTSISGGSLDILNALSNVLASVILDLKFPPMLESKEFREGLLETALEATREAFKHHAKQKYGDGENEAEHEEKEENETPADDSEKPVDEMSTDELLDKLNQLKGVLAMKSAMEKASEEDK